MYYNLTPSSSPSCCIFEVGGRKEDCRIFAPKGSASVTLVAATKVNNQRNIQSYLWLKLVSSFVI